MANELNYFGRILETGLTVTAKVYNSSGVQVGADINCTEAGSLSIYIGDMPTAPVGQYGVRFFNGLVILGQGFINWDGAKEIEFNLDATVSSRLANADYVEADNASIAAILVDTNELQVNQGNFATATGFATPTNITDSQTAIVSEINANEAKIDIIDTNVDAIKTKTDTLVNTDLTGIALSSEIAALNDFDPTLDTVARVTLVDTTTANTDMRGTDGANTVAPDNASITSILADTNELQLNQGNFATATGFSTPANVSDAQTAIIAEVNANESKIDIIDTNVDAIKTKTDTLVNTDLTGIALSSEIAALNNISTLEVNAQVDLALADYDAPTKAELDAAQAAIIAQVDANETKIDAIETKAQADLRQTALLAQHTATQGLINALNDLSAADVNAQVDLALTDYDGPTKAELDAAQNAIQSSISGLNNLDAATVSQAVWDYLQSATTVSASMKEAVEITLKNAKLIPATI